MITEILIQATRRMGLLSIETRKTGRRKGLEEKRSLL